MSSSTRHVNIEATRKAITAHLELELNHVRAEIKGYPTPIPACDEHFNWLLEKRANISKALTNARELSNERFLELIASSARFDEEQRQRIESNIERES